MLFLEAEAINRLCPGSRSVYPMILVSFHRSCSQLFLGLPVILDWLVRFSWNKVRELIERFAWYLAIQNLWIFTTVCNVWWFFYYSGPSRNWKIICGCGLSSPSLVHECTTELWTHSGKRYIVDVLCEHKMFRRYQLNNQLKLFLINIDEQSVKHLFSRGFPVTCN